MSNGSLTITVIGGGVIGCTIAYRLAERGAHVTLVERETVGAGATGASGGHIMVWPGEANDVRVELSKESVQLFRQYLPDIKKRSGIDPLDQDLKFFFPAFDEEEAVHLRDLAERVAKAGVATKWLDTAAGLNLEPRLSPDILGGILHPECVQIGGYQWVEALEKASTSIGVEFLQDEAVGLWENDNHVTGVALRDGIDISCNTVVLAMGAWTGHLASEWLQTELPITPYSLQRLRLKGLDEPMAATVNWGDINVSPRRDDLIHAGSIHNPTGFDAVPKKEIQKAILDKVSIAVPGLRYEVAEDRVATASWTPDRLPLVGPVDALEGVYVAVPGNDGFTMSAVMAEALTELITQKRQHPLLDLMFPSREMPQPVTE